MIYVTGDIHGAKEFNKRIFKLNLQPDDILIVMGDFGMPWIQDGTEKYVLQKLSEMPWTVAFIDGNHENFRLLNSYPEVIWRGGLTHQILPNLYHMIRGEVFNLDGNICLAAGGADSIDKAYRMPYVSWWPEEIWNALETNKIYRAATYIPIDYVFAHTAPKSIVQTLLKQLNCKPFEYKDPVSDTMEQIDIQFAKQWYFGHFHTDLRVTNKHRCLYKDVILLGE